MILVGVYAIWAEGAATLASVFALGIVLVIAGIGQLFTAFMARGAARGATIGLGLDLSVVGKRTDSQDH